MVTIIFASNEYFPSSLPGCKNTCGDVKEIPFPFGISNSSIPNQGPCFIDPIHNLTYEKTQLLSGNLQISKFKNNLQITRMKFKKNILQGKNRK